MSKVTLQCVKENSKLRIKFYCFTNEEGESFNNVYNLNYNCRFPKNIRKENYFYEINDSDIKLSTSNTAPFYTVNGNNIKIIEPNDSYILSKTKIYEINECVVCLDEAPNIVYLPCGHKCNCAICFDDLKKVSNKCPLCRRMITNTIIL